MWVNNVCSTPLRPLTVNVIPFINISNLLKFKDIYILTVRIAHWDTLDSSLVFSYARGRYS